MNKNLIVNEKLLALLNDLDEYNNIQKIWLNILKEHCEYVDNHYDMELMAIIEKIEEFNIKIFSEINNTYVFAINQLGASNDAPYNS